MNLMGPQTVGQGVNVATEAPTPLPQCFFLRTIFACAGSTGISSYDRTVDTNMLQAGFHFLSEFMENLPPHALADTTEKTLEHAVPVSILQRQRSPLRAGAQNPQHGFNKPPTPHR
jgi:hypothetical protein